MANPEHLAILKQGVKVWNEWRENNLRTDKRIDPDLSGLELNGINLTEADLNVTNLSNTKLRNALLIRADLTEADMRHCDLTDADLSGAHLIETNLNKAILCKATLEGAELLGVFFQGVDVRQAGFFATKFQDVKLDGANFSNSLIGSTIFSDVDLSGAKGLDTVVHDGPSTIGIQTIYRSKGNIPEVFLRGCGVPDTFITFVRSLVGTAIEYYSCFISYSSKDQAFAERLHADLQTKGVRVWFAPEELKTGDKFRTRIDEAIRIYDKLLIVLSEDSITSPWVEKEVEAAFEKERQQNRTMLFPIRLDDAVMQTNQAWAADIRRTRHIGDFSRWKDHDHYQAAFDRLLRDLKAENK